MQFETIHTINIVSFFFLTQFEVCRKKHSNKVYTWSKDFFPIPNTTEEDFLEFFSSNGQKITFIKK